jgi:hypothetical protein
VQGTIGKGRLAFSRARIEPERVEALVSGDAPAVGESVDMSLVIAKDDNWFEADVHVLAAGTVERVTPHDGGSLVRVALTDVKERDADALATFAHARVAVPFGPFLAAGGFAVVLWGPQISHFVTETWPRFVRG